MGRILFFICCIICLLQTAGFSQTINANPKNLKQAVVFLADDCPQPIQDKIKITPEDSLEYAMYPFATDTPYNNYKTVFQWTSIDYDQPKLIDYLDRNGIYNYHEDVILYAFRQYLLKGDIEERKILQRFKLKQKDYSERRKNRYKADSINEVYIPRNLEDCFIEINSFWSTRIKQEVKNMEEEEFVSRAHIGFGRWMRNNWALWGGSRLGMYFYNQGIYHPDDMTGIILTSYHRYLNIKSLDLDSQITGYKNFWEDARKKETEHEIEEFAAYNLGDTVEFAYLNGFTSERQEELYDEDSCIAIGIIKALNENERKIQVRILKDCDKRGIIYYDNADHSYFDHRKQRMVKPKKRIIKRLKRNDLHWFNYSEWEPKS